MKALPIIFNLSVLFAALFFNVQFSNAQTDLDQSKVISSSVNCSSLGELNGTVTYEYDVTLINNTDEQLTVSYTVYFNSGSLVMASHSYSDILIPGETLTSSFQDSMSSDDWKKISGCYIEWSTQ
jgi:hypothetical protein